MFTSIPKFLQNGMNFSHANEWKAEIGRNDVLLQEFLK
jgi:hypothetical protein